MHVAMATWVGRCVLSGGVGYSAACCRTGIDGGERRARRAGRGAVADRLLPGSRLQRRHRRPLSVAAGRRRPTAPRQRLSARDAAAVPAAAAGRRAPADGGLRQGLDGGGGGEAAGATGVVVGGRVAVRRDARQPDAALARRGRRLDERRRDARAVRQHTADSLPRRQVRARHYDHLSCAER